MHFVSFKLQDQAVELILSLDKIQSSASLSIVWKYINLLNMQ